MILTKVFYTFDPYLVILAWTSDDFYTDKLRVDTWMNIQTDRRGQWQYPKAKTGLV